jgi:hypothetical protein
VKRCCGEDTLGAAPRENSSMPGLYLHKSLFRNEKGFFAFAYGNIDKLMLLSLEILLWMQY